MKHLRSFQYFVLISLFILLSGCGGNVPASEISVNEISVDTLSYEETIHINNCGGKADSEQTASRSFSTTIEGIADLTVGNDLVEGSVSAKYGEYRNITKSQKLIAPAGTNMEIVLKWSEQVYAGNVTVNGKVGTYKVRVPITVEQVSSKDLGGCGNSVQVQPTQSGNTTSSTMAVVYDDFNNSAFDGSFNSSLWFKHDWVSGQVEQRDGMLIVSNGAILTSSAYSNVILNTPIFVEGKIKIDSAKHKNYNRILFVITLGENSWWYGECGINPDSQAYCYDSIEPFKDGHNFQGGSKPVQFNEWHTFRIELQPATMTFTYYIDGQKTGSHIPIDASMLKDAKAEISVGLSDSGDTIGYIDDIKIGPLP